MKEFVQMLIEALEARLGQDTIIEQTRVMKNNGVEEEGFSVRMKGSAVVPNVYLAPLYQRYRSGESVFDIADDLIDFLEHDEMPFSFDAKQFIDFETVRERIVYKLINLKKNEKLLESVPYVRYMDLAQVFLYLLETKDGADRDASVLIRHEHMKYWNVTTEQVYEAALENTPRLLPAAILGMREMLHKLRPDLDFLLCPDGGPELFIMSNDRRVNGAATLAYPDVIRNFSRNCGKNVYIIPSSVHEVILVPEIEGLCDLNAMVSEVNRTELDPKEVLSDHVYYYDFLEDKLVSV